MFPRHKTYPRCLWARLATAVLAFVVGTAAFAPSAEAKPPAKNDPISKNRASLDVALDAIWPKKAKKQHKRQRKQKALAPKNPLNSFEKNKSNLGPDTPEHKTFAKSPYLRPGQVAEPEKKPEPAKKAVAAQASLAPKQAKKRRKRRRVARNAPKIRYLGRGGISLQGDTPVVGSDLKFSYRAAGFAPNVEGPPHWRIKKHRGFIRVKFQGKKSFKFRAAGAQMGQSAHTYVDLVINGKRYWSGRYIDRRWQWYTIPKHLLSKGKNEVRVILNGPNPISIDQIRVTGSSRSQKAKGRKKGSSKKRG